MLGLLQIICQQSVNAQVRKRKFANASLQTVATAQEIKKNCNTIFNKQYKYFI